MLEHARQTSNLAQAALEAQREENQHLREHAKQASTSEEQHRQTAEELKSQVAAKEAELKMALHAKQEAESRAQSALRSITEVEEMKIATEHNKELESEVLKMQKE